MTVTFAHYPDLDPKTKTRIKWNEWCEGRFSQEWMCCWKFCMSRDILLYHVTMYQDPCELFPAPYYIYNRENSGYTENKPEPLLLKTTSVMTNWSGTYVKCVIWFVYIIVCMGSLVSLEWSSYRTLIYISVFLYLLPFCSRLSWACLTMAHCLDKALNLFSTFPSWLRWPSFVRLCKASFCSCGGATVKTDKKKYVEEDPAC